MCLPCSASRRSLLAQLCLALVAACASPAGGPVTQSMSDLTPRIGDATRSPRLRLTSADLSSVVDALTTMDAIRRLRPEFLVASNRNGSRASQPTVYVDDVYEGELWRLNTIPRSAVREVVFLHPAEASLRFGTMCGCPGGVVHVRTRISGR